MNESLAIVRCKGLANSLKILDVILKQVHVEAVGIVPEKMRGRLNILFRGRMGSIQEVENQLTFCLGTREKVDYELSIIGRVDLDIIEMCKRS